MSTVASPTRSPLEEFLRDYAETLGGAWEEVEPQVYDLLVPGVDSESKLDAAGNILRIAFDPEALPEHPGAQLASFGTPLVDGLLADAMRRGRHARLYFLGLNLHAREVPARVRRAVSSPPKMELRCERVRPLYFPQAVFWFQATFLSDQKEQEVLPVALDLHYLRLVRHLDKLLDFARLASRPPACLPEPRRSGLAAAHAAAQAEIVRALGPMANVRQRDLQARLERQVSRLTAYYADLRRELGPTRGRDSEEVQARLAAKKLAIEREERLRLAELSQKHALQIHLKLLAVLEIHQPKLLARMSLIGPGGVRGAVDLVWDPLCEEVEAAPCPGCGRPTLALALGRQGHVCCPDCHSKGGVHSPLASSFGSGSQKLRMKPRK